MYMTRHEVRPQNRLENVYMQTGGGRSGGDEMISQKRNARASIYYTQKENVENFNANELFQAHAYIP